VRFLLTSATVMNSFFVPALWQPVYPMSRMTTQVKLRADQADAYKGLSAQFSGNGFSDMRFEVAVLPTDQFVDWVEGAEAQGHPCEGCAAVGGFNCRAAPKGVLIHSRCKLVPSSLREAAAAPIKRDEITSILGAGAELQHPVSLAGTSNMDSGTR
jgi:hypothetical protein